MYDPYSVVPGGTSPAGWSCAVGRAQRDNDSWDCTGGTLGPGSPASGRLVLSQAGTNGMVVSLVACTDANVCQGYGLTQQP